MASRNYKASLAVARAALRAALKKREQTDKRITRLKQKIVALTRRLEVNPAELVGLELADQMGMSDSCRAVLAVADKELSPIEVKNRLESIGLSTMKYGNVLSSIHTTLKRLVARGEAERVSKRDAGTAYRWRGSAPHYHRGR